MQKAFCDFLLAPEMPSVRPADLIPKIAPPEPLAIQRDVAKSIQEMVARNALPVSLAALADNVRLRRESCQLQVDPRPHICWVPRPGFRATAAMASATVQILMPVAVLIRSRFFPSPWGRSANDFGEPIFRTREPY